MNHKRIAVDLAKNVFQIAQTDHSGKVIARKRLCRVSFQQFIATLDEPTHFIAEACGSAHYWGRTLQTAGHTITLLHAGHVAPFRRRNKNDKNDCDAILDASRSIDIKPIPIKSELQQHIQHLHCLREGFKKTHNQRINNLRAIFREQGFDCPEGRDAFMKIAYALADQPVMRPMVECLHEILEDICTLSKRIDAYEKKIAHLTKDNHIVTCLDKVTGIGVLTASAFVTTLVTPDRFNSGRMVSAWVGATPKEHSSGHTRKLGKISRAGDTYLRTLFIHGARSALLAAKRRAANKPETLTRLQQWAIQISDRIGFNKATVALANKLIRICWAVWRHQRQFDGNFIPAASSQGG